MLFVAFPTNASLSFISASKLPPIVNICNFTTFNPSFIIRCLLLLRYTYTQSYWYSTRVPTFNIPPAFGSCTELNVIIILGNDYLITGVQYAQRYSGVDILHPSRCFLSFLSSCPDVRLTGCHISIAYLSLLNLCLTKISRIRSDSILWWRNILLFRLWVHLNAHNTFDCVRCPHWIKGSVILRTWCELWWNPSHITYETVSYVWG